MWYSNIMVAYDGSPSSKYAIRIARDMSDANPEARVILVHVVNLGGAALAGASVSQNLMDLGESASAYLEKVAGSFRGPASVRLLEGSSPAELIVRSCEEENCDVIVMGSRGIGGVRGYLGSVSQAVVREAHACVLIAKFEDEEV